MPTTLALPDTQPTPPPTYSIIFDNLDFYLRASHQSSLHNNKNLHLIHHIAVAYKTGFPLIILPMKKHLKTYCNRTLAHLSQARKHKHFCAENLVSSGAECYVGTCQYSNHSPALWYITSLVLTDSRTPFHLYRESGPTQLTNINSLEGGRLLKFKTIVSAHCHSGSAITNG